MEDPLHGRHLNKVIQDYVDNTALNYLLLDGWKDVSGNGMLFILLSQAHRKRTLGRKRSILL